MPAAMMVRLRTMMMRPLDFETSRLGATAYCPEASNFKKREIERRARQKRET
jgi:hypothetical protein